MGNRRSMESEMDAVPSLEQLIVGIEGLGEKTTMAVEGEEHPVSAAEPGAGHNMHYSAESGVGRLRAMARALEEMDSARRSWNSPPPMPKYKELKLQVMILWHVRMCILLFQYETSYREIINWRKNTKSRGLARKEYLSQKYSPLPLKINCAECPRAADVNNQLAESLNLFHQSLQMLKNYHEVACDMVLPLFPADDPREEVSEADNNTNHQEILLNVFHELEEMRRSRSYAAPSGEEIAQYREIRKWSMSSLKYTHARCTWQIYQRCHRGNTPWIFVDEDYVADDCWSMWAEFRLSMAFDEIPEILWILKDRVHRFSRIHPNGMNDAVKSKDNIGGDASMMDSDDFRIVAAGAREGPTRMDYLCDILSALKMMEPLGMMLTPRQAAIHTVLQEHIAEAIWLYNNESCDQHTGVQHTVRNRRTLHDMQMDHKLRGRGRGISLTQSHEDLHEEILLSVEVIKASYVFTPPTQQELDLYYRIAHKMGPVIEIYGDTRGGEDDFHDGGLSIMKYVMNKIYSKEMEFINVLHKESLKMLQLAFPFLPKELNYSDALIWFRNNEQYVINELVAMVKLPCGLKYFENFLLILEEVKALFVGLISGLDHGNDTLDQFLHDVNCCRSAAKGILVVSRFSRRIPH